MTDLYIFRHGDTERTENSNILSVLFRRDGGGLSDLPILPKGIPALEKIGAYLKNIPTDANFTSPYLRCKESSKIVGSISNRIYKVDEGIREFEEEKRNFAGFKNRITDFLDRIDKKNYSAVSICTHGAVIAAIKHLITSGKFSFFQVWDFPAPGNLIIIKDGKVESVDFNSK